MLPRGLVEDIQQFQVEDFAKRYFSTHRVGFLFRRRIPVEQLMTWQKVCVTLSARARSQALTQFPSGATPASTPGPKSKSTQGCSQGVQGDSAHHGRP